MKKVFFKLALLALLVPMCLSCSKDEGETPDMEIAVDFNATESVAHPYTFSEALKSEKWKEMDSDERNKLFQIPSSRLSKMDEMDLALTCVFFYPRRFDNLASEHPMTGFDRAREVNNGFDKLYNMPMAGDALIYLLKNYDELQGISNSASVAGSSLSSRTISEFQQNYICCLLASKGFSEKMSASTQLNVQNEVDQLIREKKSGSSSLLNLNFLYAVRARLLEQNRAVNENEKMRIDSFIYTVISSVPDQDFINFVDSIIKRVSSEE